MSLLSACCRKLTRCEFFPKEYFAPRSFPVPASEMSGFPPSVHFLENWLSAAGDKPLCLTRPVSNFLPLSAGILVRRVFHLRGAPRLYTLDELSFFLATIKLTSVSPPEKLTRPSLCILVIFDTPPTLLVPIVGPSSPPVAWIAAGHDVPAP